MRLTLTDRYTHMQTSKRKDGKSRGRVAEKYKQWPQMD